MTELRDKAVVLCECNIWSKAEDKATEPPSAARAALGLSNDDNAQEADFRQNTR